MSDRTLAEWLTRLERLHPRDIELGLERVASVARTLQLLPLNSAVVTVAGTNGKGTTVAVLDQLLRDQGISTGVYTSPHLLAFNERIAVNGEYATDGTIVEAFMAIDCARGDTSLTYFEFATLAALWVFKQRSPDVAILEVGLGGRLDAINIADCDIAVITSIALDHQDWLGDDREVIGMEKAGILRRGVPVYCADLDPPDSVIQQIEAYQCPSWWVRDAALPDVAASGLRAENVATALAVAEHFKVPLPDASELARMLQRARPRGRLERLRWRTKELILDVAHNPAAASNLANWLTQNPAPGRTVAVLGALSDKDISAMMRCLREQISDWWVCGLPGVSRALSAEALAEALTDAGVSGVNTATDPAAAAQAIDSYTDEGDRIVVWGSFHTVAAVLQNWELEQELEQELG